MAKGEEWKTTFHTCYGLFESLVMPFSLTIALVTFQDYMDNVLAPDLEPYCSAYLDDILIYVDNFKEYQQDIRLVLHAVVKAGLPLKPEKCEFHEQEVKYLGLIISSEGIKVDAEKIHVVQDWEPPINLKDIRTFLGFANFHSHFVWNYSHIVQPSTFSTPKGVPLAWKEDQQMTFDALKDTFTSTPVLASFDPDRDFIVEKDACNYVSASVLSQCNNDNVLHPVTYFWTKHSAAKCNYEIYNKELMAIVYAFEEWHPKFKSIINPICILSGHKYLEYFMTTKLLNYHQAH
jgi:hypothetical protein